MITTINEYRKIMEAQISEKDIWWDKNYKVLIKYAENLDYDDWMAILKDDEDFVVATLDSTSKHQALTLLSMLDMEELNDILSNSKMYENINQFTNIGYDEDKNRLGNCTKCGSKGCLIDGHVCYDKHGKMENKNY